jgi:Uma2 family endonuclease
MSTTRVSIDEYLDRVDRHGFHDEYVDGKLREKAMGGNIHSVWLMAIATYFHRHRHEWGIRVLPDLHVNVRVGNYRIGDVVIAERSVEMDSGPLQQTPVAVFEILSPTDSESETIDRLRDYEAMGTTLLFIVDPENAIFKQYRAGRLTPMSDFAWPARNVRFPFADIALEID